jgi:hypothetical protein
MLRSLLIIIGALALTRPAQADAISRCAASSYSSAALPINTLGDTATAPGDDFDIGTNACGRVFTTPVGEGKDRLRKLRFANNCEITVQAISQSANYDLSAYVITDCAQVDASCVAGADDVTALGTETFSFSAIAERDYFLVIDGWGGAQGPFALTISAPATCVVSDRIFGSGFD